MKNLVIPLAAALLAASTSFAAPAATTVNQPDLSRFAYTRQSGSNVFANTRQQRVDKLNALMESSQPRREQAAEPETQYTPTTEIKDSSLFGDLDGPDGQMWFYSGNIDYDIVEVNEYSTEYRPKAFSVDIFNASMEKVGSVSDVFVLKDDEVRVRDVDMLPIVTRNYFNSDDSYEIALTLYVNPYPYGMRIYTYVYSLDSEADAEGNVKPIKVINGMVSDVCDASSEGNENVIMSFLAEGNDSGFTDEELENPDNYWEYQMHNFMELTSYAKADESGELTQVFKKRVIYFQAQGNQQDDPLAITYVRNGKPALAFAYYKEVFYDPYNSYMDEATQREDNELIIELYELSNIADGFELKQSTSIPFSRPDVETGLYSYYSVGAFRYRDDISYGDDGRASFIITRRDYLPSSDSEVLSQYVYRPDGTLLKKLFEKANGHMPLADLPGFDPQELFISIEDGEYIFTFLNLRTFEPDFSMNYGLDTDGSGEPDYMMANIERTAVGDSYMYAAEMRLPAYDDINDTNYMRVVWLDSKGNYDHMDYVNMGNNVNYAKLYLDAHVLKPDFYHSDAKQEYMMLIKRAYDEDNTALTREELLIGQASTDSFGDCRDLLLLGPTDELGSLATIAPIYGEVNRLMVIYAKILPGHNAYTTHYYTLPLDGSSSGVENVSTLPTSAIAFDGTTARLAGASLEVFDLRGVRVAAGYEAVSLDGLAKGIYIVRGGDSAIKVARD